MRKKWIEKFNSTHKLIIHAKDTWWKFEMYLGDRVKVTSGYDIGDDNYFDSIEEAIEFWHGSKSFNERG